MEAAAAEREAMEEADAKERAAGLKAEQERLSEFVRLGQMVIDEVEKEVLAETVKMVKKVEEDKVVESPFLIGGSFVAKAFADKLKEKTYLVDQLRAEEANYRSDDDSNWEMEMDARSETRSPPRKKTRRKTRSSGACVPSSSSSDSGSENNSDSDNDESLSCDDSCSDPPSEHSSSSGYSSSSSSDGNLNEEKPALTIPDLVSNDVDIYKSEDLNGDFDMSKAKGSVTYHKVEGFPEINVIKCTSLSGDGFLANNDINATGVCIEVEGDEAELMSIKASPQFWEFFLSTGDNRILKASKNGVGIRTFVRLAYKSYQMKIPYSNKDPDGNKLMNVQEKFFRSHKEKIEKMNRDWSEGSPFLNYDITNKNNDFYLEKAINRVDCENCKVGRANKNCVQGFCKKCCNKTDKECAAHKSKEKKAAEH
jgi:hypothetical protein